LKRGTARGDKIRREQGIRGGVKVVGEGRGIPEACYL